jgi:hypothetical protein
MDGRLGILLLVMEGSCRSRLKIVILRSKATKNLRLLHVRFKAQYKRQLREELPFASLLKAPIFAFPEGA